MVLNLAIKNRYKAGVCGAAGPPGERRRAVGVWGTAAPQGDNRLVKIYP